MKLSTKGRYGLRAFIDIAMYAEEEPVSLASVAKRQDLSISYLEQLMTKIKKAGLIESVRGAGGGYVLARPAREISVGDVLRALEGDLMPVNCVGQEQPGVTGCDAQPCCSSWIVWKRINDSINETVNNIFIDELVEESRKALKEGK
ncbi:transcriptional regulator, BadM/Rrf2 family [Lachnospiraceae bacterium XBB1006]|nr:transcriptional regulator, BadM/Rrf2 family [Lachnospiraceae bacterium XBB1006]